MRNGPAYETGDLVLKFVGQAPSIAKPVSSRVVPVNVADNNLLLISGHFSRARQVARVK